MLLLLLPLVDADDATANLDLTLQAGRCLAQALREIVKGSGLSVEKAQILSELYGARCLRKTTGLRADEHGFVLQGDLREQLLLTKPGLSRRMDDLRRASLVEIRSVDQVVVADTAQDRPHGNAQPVRISDKGVAKIKPVVERFRALAEELYQGVPDKNRIAQHVVNYGLIERLRQRSQTRKR